jgi:uncharacterized alpha-E superfamily protein
MERAVEDTARPLDVHFHTLLEQSQQTYLLRWDSIIRISGEHERFFEHYPEATPQTVFEFLGFREDNPSSILDASHTYERTDDTRSDVTRAGRPSTASTIACEASGPSRKCSRARIASATK